MISVKTFKFQLLMVSAFIFSWSAAQAVITGEYVPGEFLVKLKNSRDIKNPAALQAFAQTYNMTLVGVVTPQSQTVLFKAPLVERTEMLLDALKQHPDVQVVEPNYIYRSSNLPNDTRLGDLWGLINQQKDVGGVDIDAASAWAIQTGSRDVVVAVIDTGVNYRDPDLINNMWVNIEEKNGEAGIDDDGNGYVDDIYGYNFANDNPDPMDDNNHGSHCAGTIGAEGDNGIGVVGVNWQVRMMALKFLSRTGGGTLEAAIKAIDYATDKKVDVMNNSWGGGGKSDLLEEAIERAEEAGILFVAAAGNNRSNNDARPMYPASYPTANVLSVAAIDSRGNRASFSNYGRQTVHVAAPGVNILSTGRSNNLVSMSGTSMAAPHVAGVAALVKANEPSLDYAQLKERILLTSVPRENLSGIIAHGVLNAFNALTNQVGEPDENDPVGWPHEEESIATPHPYENNMDESWTVTVPGASKLSVHFNTFETENNYDFVYFYNAQGTKVGEMTGLHSQSYSPVVDGDTMVIRFVSDGSIVRHGFSIDRVHYQASSLL
jgi:thermitase